MANVKELLRTEANGSISFGDYSLEAKTKLADFKFQDSVYKVKTFKEVPGSAVHDFRETERQLVFQVEAADDIHITLELEPEKEYKVFIDDTNIGKMKSSLGGKIDFSIEMNEGETVKVDVIKL